MAVVVGDIGSTWGQRKLFGEETEDTVEEFAAVAKAAAVKAAEEYAAAVKAAEEYAAAVKAAEEYAAAVKAAEEFAAAAKAAAKAAEEAAKAAEEMAAAIHSKQLHTAASAGFEKESATSKVPNEGVRQLYPCLCYPKELLKKEDEVRNGPHYVEEPLRPFVVERRKMFIEWAAKHGKNYNGLYEARLRYKIWINTKERMEQLCSKSGRTFSMNKMTKDADQTQIEFKLGIGGRVKPMEQSLSDVKRCILGTMGESWMEIMGKEFEKWAERHKRVYSSTEEREKRLLAYLYNRRSIHMSDEHFPGVWGHGNDLENMDHFPWEKVLVPPVECSRCRPCKYAPQGRSCPLQAPQQG